MENPSTFLVLLNAFIQMLANNKRRNIAMKKRRNKQTEREVERIVETIKTKK